MTAEEMAREIQDLENKIGSLHGDPYWIALYRIKKLASDLAALVLQSKGDKTT